ncbi:relaxase/mobilization nuclease domain-containing protein, partial [Vibrio parahaemolyticus]|nr:relaxase/mobilization nuclease domain-containing protein [Vibrio parahaemolyticus]
GPVEYLLGKDRNRDGATLDRGDPDEIQALIDSSPYAKKYTSGVLSFEEADLDRQTKDKVMSSFEKALLPGLEADQYSCLWVEHRDKGRLELNFVVPNVELQTGKRLQPYFDKADKPRINAWKTGMNASLKLHDPDDPINKRELTTPRNLPASKQEAARAITDGLLSLAGNGELRTRQDVVNA